MIDSQGPIPGMIPAQALDVIPDMADHSQKWYDGGSTRSDGAGLEGMKALTKKLENLGREMKKLKESFTPSKLDVIFAKQLTLRRIAH